MKILLTNDDGINAPGLWAAARALRQSGEVFVVAPSHEQSGVGASLTLRSPIAVETVDPDPALAGEGPNPLTAFSVDGTPGDSAILGLESLVGSQPKIDLVVSGINSGSNLGWDVMVSGTVGAAIQGYVRGYVTVAISVGSVNHPQFEVAARLLQLLAGRLAEAPPAGGCFLNVNLPNLPADQIAGLRVTQLGGRSYGENVTLDRSSGENHYRIDRNKPIPGNPKEDTDIWAVKNKFISITPLQISLGYGAQIPEVEGLVEGLFQQLPTPPEG